MKKRLGTKLVYCEEKTKEQPGLDFGSESSLCSLAKQSCKARLEGGQREGGESRYIKEMYLHNLQHSTSN